MIFTAQDKQEAMKKAADHFGCEKERLKVRVVEQPKKKLLGLKNVEGRYEIEMEEEKPKRDPKNDGRVKVENGEIIVKDPVEDGLPSSVFIKKGNMELFVNGEPVKSTMNFREEDEITVTFNDEKPKIHSHIVFSDDKVRAELHIESTKGKRFYLEDSEAQNRIVLEPVEEEIFPKKVTYDEVVELLKQAGIPEKFHDSQAIQQAIESGESTQILVAKGMDPVESQETKIKYCDEIFVKEITRGMEPVVSKGSKLAEKTASAQPGTPGVTVQGEEIPVREVEDIPLEAGDGAVLKGNAVYAEIDGRPILDKGVVKVIPLLTVVGDMDKDTDHIDFDGDVFIKGNIQDNMVVKATGSVMVLGSIYHSDILALHHIEVDGKMIGGRLQAGQENSIYHIIIPVVENMIENIEGFFEGLHRAKEEDVQKIVEVINDTKEKLDGNIDELEQTSVSMNAAQLEILNTLKADIRKAFLDIKLLRQSGFDKLNEVYAKLHDQLEAMKEEVETVSNITIKYVQGANLNASGDVYITGKGAYQSNVTAGLSILMDNPQSVVKGGTLIAGKRIKAGTVGTPGEIHTLCKVLDREGTVEARFHKGAVVKVRNEEIKITTID